DLFQVRGEELELALLAGLEPADLGTRGGAGEARDQRYRCGDGVITLTAHLAQIRYLPILQALGIGLGTVQEARDARSGEQCVMLRLQRGKLLAADISAATRHHHCGVPAKERQSSAKGVESLELLL